ncbi:MAG TPA: FapA family protein [Spirochaetia bacterium]|nr:FapA family protein [Spirochaetales bacterium]HRZ89276.1 FapA family protein [Spirochaetia bacterium]
MESKSPEKKAAKPREMKLSFSPGGRKNDGFVEISVPEDAMEVQASFHPAVGGGAPLSQEYVRELLSRAGVTEGILEDVIGDSVLSCNLDQHPLREVVIARGVPAEEEIPGHLKLLKRFEETPLDAAVPDGSLDWKDLSPVIVVTRGERIADKISARAGTPGKTVRGEAIPAKKRSVTQYLPGRNVRMDGEALVADVDGRFSLSGNRIDVEEVLVAKGGVGYHTGHIVFPGDVTIEGPVRDGFKVHSGGSILAKDTMDVFDVNAKKDITCAGGLIGHQKGFLKAGGVLRAKFAQNCRVAVRGDVFIPGSLVSCRLFTLGMLEMGDKGRILAGETFAVHGVRCGWIGSDTGQTTYVHVGIDFTVQQRLDLANERLRLIQMKRDKLEELGKTRPSAKLEALKQELDKAASELSALISDLLPKLDADERAFVEIRGGAFPGAVIEICRVRFQIQEEIKKTVFRLDKASGRIIQDHT